MIRKSLPVITGTAFVALGIAVMPRAAAASQLTFTSLATFQAAAGTLATENFNSTAPATLTSSGAFSTPFTKFTLSGNGNGDFVAVAPGTNGANIDTTNFLDWSSTNPLTGGQGDIGIGPTFTFTFPVAITAFGFDWNDPDSSDSYKITINGTDYSGPPFAHPGTGTGFFGVVASAGETFTQVTFTHANVGGFLVGLGADNVQFSASSVPEPASMILLGSGLAGLVARRRRRAR